ncbi:MAG: sterol desaturase family protein [Myxococcales bacterium]|nr:sterol desaturase family protein [Myxococcales bacterium]
MHPWIPLVLGLLTWTLLEYGLHRYVFHHGMWGRAAAREHTRHHKEVSWFAPWSSKLRLAAAVLTPLALAGWALGGGGTALAYVGGIVGGWLGYELLHRRIHVAAPLNGYGAWARRHHLHHHFGNPATNHGVTSPLWDWVFGTHERVAHVRVPPRHAPKLPWLLDEAGHIAAAFTGTYSLKR